MNLEEIEQRVDNALTADEFAYIVYVDVPKLIEALRDASGAHDVDRYRVHNHVRHLD